MWKTKKFKTFEGRLIFINKIKDKYQYNLTFVENGYGIEYKKLKNYG